MSITHDLPPELAAANLPEGYIVAMAVRYQVVRTDGASGRRYDHTVQLFNEATHDIPRGVGMTFGEALEHAIANAGGDDGLSKRFREMLQGPRS